MKNYKRNYSIMLPLIFLLTLSLACALIPFQDAPERPEDPPEVLEPTDLPIEPTAPTTPTETATPAAETPQADANVAFSPPPAEAGACANPFYPMAPGYQWVYEVTSQGETSQIGLTVSEVQGDQAILNAVYLETGVVSELTVDCRDGEILNFPTILLSFIFGDVGGTIDVEHVDGIYAPNYDYLVDNLANAEWSGEYLATGMVSADVDGDEYLGTLAKSPLSMNWQVEPQGDDVFETVEVGAGTYENAIRVNRQIELDFDASLTEEGVTTNLAATLEMETINWFVPNTGMIQQEVSEADIRIFGVSFPVVFDGDVELIEFSTTE